MLAECLLVTYGCCCEPGSCPDPQPPRAALAGRNLAELRVKRGWGDGEGQAAEGRRGEEKEKRYDSGWVGMQVR